MHNFACLNIQRSAWGNESVSKKEFIYSTKQSKCNHKFRLSFDICIVKHFHLQVLPPKRFCLQNLPIWRKHCKSANCPDITISNSPFVSLSLFLFVFLGFCLFVSLSLCLYWPMSGIELAGQLENSMWLWFLWRWQLLWTSLWVLMSPNESECPLNMQKLTQEFGVKKPMLNFSQ